MKKLFAAFAACLVTSIALLSGCASTGSAPTVPKITPAQFFVAACPPVKAALAMAPMFADTLSPTVEADLAKAEPMAFAACKSGATVSVVNVQQFSDTVLPAASAVVQAAPASLVSDADKAKISGAIALAQLAVDAVSAVAQNAQAASAGSAASAPVAASTPLAGAAIK